MALAVPLCIGFVLVVIAFLAAFYALSVYNGLVVLKNNMDKAWANIDVVLKQRSDLIPNLVEAVKGYMKHERTVLEEITQLRTSMMSAQGPAEKAKASEGISNALKSIFAVAENYPKLQASDNFLDLQKQLAEMENMIADRREFYNDSVLLYNTRIQVLPDSLVAIFLFMKPREYFKAEEGEKKEAEIKFQE